MLLRRLANDIRESFLHDLRTRNACGDVLHRIHTAKGFERSAFQRQVIDVFQLSPEFLA
jgi:hypothetical protein